MLSFGGWRQKLGSASSGQSSPPAGRALTQQEAKAAESALRAALARTPPYEQRGRLLLQLAELQHQLGQTARAKATLAEALAVHPPRPELTAQAHDLLGAIYELEHPGSAATAFTAAFAARQQQDAPPLELAERAGRIAQLFLYAQQRVDAEPWLERGLHLYRQADNGGYQADNSAAAGAAGLLVEQAALMHADGDQPRALALLQEALALHQQACGPASAEAGRDLRLIGQIHEELGDFAAAVASYESALAIQEAGPGRSAGADMAAAGVSATVRLLHTLACAYLKQGRTAAAVERLQYACRIAPVPLDANGIFAADTLGSLFVELGRYPEAERVYQAAVSSCKLLAAEQPAVFGEWYQTLRGRYLRVVELTEPGRLRAAAEADAGL